MKVLVLGGGAREHALLLALSRDPGVGTLFCAPGNAGTAELAEQHAVDLTDAAAVVALARDVGADLVVVGPEAPLVAGVADAVRAAGLVCFGPSAAAAQIEGSKAFAKDVMAAAGVATASAQVFDDTEACAAHLATTAPPYVVKADGLAAGKGVHVGSDLGQATAFAREALHGAGSRVVVEQFLAGPEVSLFALTDGRIVVPLLPAQDFKRVGDGDTGPNTGGMGAYAPLTWLPGGTVEQLQDDVLQPVVDELRRRGTPFAGLLYAGLAMTADGPQVIEFNCRFGDPETQVVLALLETPLAQLLHAAATGRLGEIPALRWRAGAAVTVVVAAEGYPGRPVTGDEVAVGTLPGGVVALHAGTTRSRDRVVSSGGRVLSVTAVGDDLAAARAAAYAGVGAVQLRGAHWRADIGLSAERRAVAVPTRRPGARTTGADEDPDPATAQVAGPDLTPEVAAYWQRFCAETGADPAWLREVAPFGDSPAMADELLGLVLAGGKRATAGLLEPGESPPAAGDHWLVLDGAGRPGCVLRMTQVRIGPLASVDDAFARDEGEGDLTRGWWLDAHRAFFRRTGAGSDPDAVVFERFALVWPPPRLPG